jgi:hypothetical protein
MSDIEHEEIKAARKVHFNLPHHLKDSERVLSASKKKIYHQLKFRPQNEEETRTQNEFKEWLEEHDIFYTIGEVKKVSEARDYLRFQIPFLEKTPEEWFRGMARDNEWERNESFELLHKFLQAGDVPGNLTDDWLPTKPTSLKQALLKARERGFSFPDKFLESRPTSYGKEEAWYASRQIALTQRCFWKESEDFNSRSPIVSSISSSFLVPDPDYPDKIPFVVDQMWVIRESGARVRLLAIETDSEFHLSEEQHDKDRIRDEKLARQGFEVYRIADWWCRVDPWRVIGEVYGKAGIISDVDKHYPGSNWSSINDYFCANCSRPMIRFEDDWIVNNPELCDDPDYLEYSAREHIVHRECADWYY